MIEAPCAVMTAVTVIEMIEEKNVVEEEVGGVHLVMTVDRLCAEMTADHQCAVMIVTTDLDVVVEEEVIVIVVAEMIEEVGMIVEVATTVAKTIGGQDHGVFHLRRPVRTDVMTETDKDSLQGTRDLQNVPLSLNNSLNSNNNNKEEEERPMVGRLWSNVDILQ